MRVTISWTTHNRRYTIDLVEFLKQMNIQTTEQEIRVAAKKLLEQNEIKQED